MKTMYFYDVSGEDFSPSSGSSLIESIIKNVNVLIKENTKFLLELKESLLIMRDKPSLNRNIRSAPLYLFDKE